MRREQNILPSNPYCISLLYFQLLSKNAFVCFLDCFDPNPKNLGTPGRARVGRLARGRSARAPPWDGSVYSTLVWLLVLFFRLFVLLVELFCLYLGCVSSPIKSPFAIFSLSLRIFHFDSVPNTSNAGGVAFPVFETFFFAI